MLGSGGFLACSLLTLRLREGEGIPRESVYLRMRNEELGMMNGNMR